MSMVPTLAVVIPNRNDSVHLAKCLDSVLEQSVRPDQIVVVDDQSTDNSIEVIQNKLRDIAGVQLIVNHVCLGTMGALNEGLQHVNSDYVLFLSSNDYVVNGIFERAKCGIAAAESPGVWSAMVWVVDGAGRNLRLYPSPVVALSDTFLAPAQCVHLAMTTGHWFTGTTLMYHRETLQKIGGFEKAYQGMADLLAALTIASIKGACFSPTPLGVVRQHEDGLMWRTLTNLPLLDVILEKMEKEGPSLSPALFSPFFCDLFRRRIRFTAIRAFHDASWQTHLAVWRGCRYRLIQAVSPFFGRQRKLLLTFAFLVLRPFTDIFSIIWYRLMGTAIVRMRLRK